MYDTAGALRSGDTLRLEAEAAKLESDGTRVVVYVRAYDANVNETTYNAAALMSAWDVETAPGRKDGLVFFFNLRPGDLPHGSAAIYAGKTLTARSLPSTSIMYVLIFIALLVVDARANAAGWSLDSKLEERLPWWRRLAEFARGRWRRDGARAHDRPGFSEAPGGGTRANGNHCDAIASCHLKSQVAGLLQRYLAYQYIPHSAAGPPSV